ncbi:MAG TPA: hypothetical protein VFV53_00300 [Candidatus Limnocylindrales bacterium]|nr:hypothetical protein [Candidatus Limnocylindrales bacterium]
MAYDPALFSFILVGVVGGVAVVMNASSGWEVSHELAQATDTWTAPVVTRSYRNDATARARIAREAAVLLGHGYRAVLRREVGGDPVPGDGEAAHGADGQAGPQPGTIVITYDLA